MNPVAALEDLERIARSPTEAIQSFVGRGRSRTWEIFWQRHVPLLALYPISALLCPYSHIFGRGPSLSTHVLLPLGLVLCILAQAALFDRVLEYSSHRTLEVEDGPDFSQIAFYLHLPLSAGGAFFLIHPGVGYLMLFAAAAYCVSLAIGAQCRARGINLARALTAYLSAAILPLLGLLGLALLYNIYHTAVVLRGLE